MTMKGKWIYLMGDDGNHYLTGEIVAMHGEHYFEFRPLHMDDDADGEPPFTYLAETADLTREGSRLFDSEQALRDWCAWLWRPETPKELAAAGKHLRPVN